VTGEDVIEDIMRNLGYIDQAARALAAGMDYADQHPELHRRWLDIVKENTGPGGAEMRPSGFILQGGRR
jgi:hypothetical protein